MSEHQHPIKGDRTQRAIYVERMGEWLDGDELSAADRALLEDQITRDLSHMAESGLCEFCGYPLNNSAPHPEARPDWHHCRHVQRFDIAQLGRADERYLCRTCGAKVTVEPPAGVS